MRLATGILALLAAALLMAETPVRADSFINSRMSLVEAIDAARGAGLTIGYSSELVKPWMRVRETPVEDNPANALGAALAAYRLKLDHIGGNHWLVVRDEPAAAIAVAAPPRSVPEPVAESPQPVDEITIVGSRHALFQRKGTSRQFLSAEEIREMPHLADDTFRALQRLPGTASSDFQAPFNLRGGAIDEVRVVLDGLEIFEPFHMRTLFRPLSIIDPGIIDRAELLSGGFTAEHGNYMSGVVDFSSGRAESPPAHEVGLSFVSAFARSRGQFADGRGSYLLSARRGYLDLLAEAVVSDEEELKPRYADLFGSVAWDLSDTFSVTARLLLANDDVSFVDPKDGEAFGEDSRIRYAWLVADAEPWPGITSTTSVFAGDAHSDEDGLQDNPPPEDIARRYIRNEQQYGLQSDWRAKLSERHLLKAGIRYRELDAAFNYSLDSVRRSAFVNNGMPVTLQRDIQLDTDGNDATAYLAWRMRATRKLAIELGLRWDRQDYSTAVADSQTSPRVNLVYSPGPKTSISAAWGLFHQPQALRDLDVPDGDTTYYPAQQAEHFVLGARHEFGSGLEMTLDLYNKDYSDLRPRYENLLDIYEFAPESNFDRAAVVVDAAQAHGAELTVRNADPETLDWWLSYVYAKVEDEIDGIDVPRSWDQRHAVTASVAWRGEKWTFSAVGRYHSGWPRTELSAVPVYDGNGDLIGIDTDLSARNQSRYDDYLRFDIRASRKVDVSHGEFEYYFELYNIFDETNECCTSDHILTIGPGVGVSPITDDFLPRFPSFGFVWRFGPGSGS